MVEEQLRNYLEAHNKFPSEQHGFRKNHSTSTLLNTLIQDLANINSAGKTAAVISLDLSKAFNLLNKNVLFLKLEKIGIGKDAITWINSFLTDRTQQVRINETYSKPRNINIGTPQGSKLSPLLFLCLLADIKADIGDEEGKIYQFADDINLVVSGENVQEVERKIQNLTHKIVNYLHANQLALNFDKFQFMVIRKAMDSKTPVFINIQGVKVDEKEHCTVLGITINNKLNWKDHLNYLKPQLRKTMMVLRRMKYRIPHAELRRIAISLFLSKIRYGLTVYGTAKLSQEDTLPNTTKDLQIVTNTMMRMIRPGRIIVKEWGQKSSVHNYSS